MIDQRSRKFGVMMLCGSVLILSGCSQLGNPIDAITGNVASPDEFQVIARKPLRMPSSIRLQDLPEPRLGTRSPLEPDPNADAVRALLGSGASGGTGATSASEAALVGAAKASSTENAPVTQEEIDRADSQSNELQSVFELTGLNEDSADADTLDADAEARRLQTEGSPAPVNPNPETEQERKSNSAIFKW